MTSDPKHLPPRDCLVVCSGLPSSPYDPCQIAVGYHEPNGFPEWFSQETGDPIDPSRVITWRELPEVE